MKKNAVTRALKYALIFVFALTWEIPLCYVNDGTFIDIFVGGIMPIYMAAVILILYPLFRYINRECKVFSLMTLGLCAIIGVPLYIVVGATCGTFGLGSGLAYIIYGYAIIVSIAVICICDTIISLAVRMIRKFREQR